MLRRTLLACCLLTILGNSELSGQTDPSKKEKAPLRFWKDVPNAAEVAAATYLGGKGHEWLVGGGFQADGTIVLAGNVRGPVFDLGVAERVIGTDLEKPAVAESVAVLERGEPKKDKEGKPVWEKPSWRHDGVTGFVVHCAADLKKVVAVHRLPWASAALTSAAVGPDGAIYLAGRATDQISKFGGDVEVLQVAADAARKDGKCAHAFVARLRADGAKAEWVRHSTGPCDAPQVAVQENGSIQFSAQEVWSFDQAGKQLRDMVIPGGVRKTTSISPLDGSIVVGGEHHWPTGREPWRCPILNIHQPDGKLRTQLYDWGGPYVGLDNCRQVSDTAIRWVTHEPDGSILIYAWSDGGNSVMTTQPADVRRPVGHKGLGITAAGAGVLSCAYLVRIEPKNYTATAWTIWLAFAPTGKPNSIWIDNLARGPDGSVAIAGRTAWGLWQTKNKLTDAEPTGPYVAVIDPRLTGVRFCSVVPGAGAAEVSFDNAAWGIASGTVNGQARLLFVGGAVPPGEDSPTITRTALQEKHGGGWCDGYALLLDLPAARPVAKPSEEPLASVDGPLATSASFEKGAPFKDAKSAPRVPDEDTIFHFKADSPRWVTVDAEFRDRPGKTWPSFLSGKPVDGTLTYRNQQVAASFAVACPLICQPNGDQDRRILGDLFEEKRPPSLQFTLQSLGEPKSAEVKTVDKAGKDVTRTIEYCEAKGTLELAGKKIAVTPRVTYRFSGPKNAAIDKVQVTAWLTLKAAELGLRTPGAETEIDVRISMTGATSAEAPPKK